MNYKIPRVLEKSPSIAGINIVPFIFIVFGALFFVFTVRSNWKMSLVPLILAGIFYFLDKQFNKLKGGLIRLMLSPFVVKCVRFDTDIKGLLLKNTDVDSLDEGEIRDKIVLINSKIDQYLEHKQDDIPSSIVLEKNEDVPKYLDA